MNKTLGDEESNVNARQARRIDVISEGKLSSRVNRMDERQCENGGRRKIFFCNKTSRKTEEDTTERRFTVSFRKKEKVNNRRKGYRTAGIITKSNSCCTS